MIANLCTLIIAPILGNLSYRYLRIKSIYCAIPALLVLIINWGMGWSWRNDLLDYALSSFAFACVLGPCWSFLQLKNKGLRLGIGTIAALGFCTFFILESTQTWSLPFAKSTPTSMTQIGTTDVKIFDLSSENGNELCYDFYRSSGYFQKYLDTYCTGIQLYGNKVEFKVSGNQLILFYNWSFNGRHRQVVVKRIDLD